MCVDFLYKYLLLKLVYFCDHNMFILWQVAYFEIQSKYKKYIYVAKVMIFSHGALADLFALTRFLIPVAFTDIAVDVGEQVQY